MTPIEKARDVAIATFCQSAGGNVGGVVALVASLDAYHDALIEAAGTAAAAVLRMSPSNPTPEEKRMTDSSLTEGRRETADVPWTSGPWKIEFQPLSARIGNVEYFDIIAPMPVSIGICFLGSETPYDHAEMAACVRLIAAAPEMAEKLDRTTEKLMAALEMLESFGCYADSEFRLVRENRDFIARIRGDDAGTLRQGTK